MLQAGGVIAGERALPFSAPKTRFNGKVHATRRLGIGSLALDRFQRVAKHYQVTVNDVALTLVGHALERYADEYGERPSRPLVAVCPMAVRSRITDGAATQISAISVALGEPGTRIVPRLHQVHRSSMEAKNEAARLSPQAQMDYLLLLGGLTEAVNRTPLGGVLPPSTNVNVSNVVGPRQRCYFAGGEIVGSYPVSTLAGGTKINVTFNSYAGRMDFAAIADALSIPDPQRIADFMLEAMTELERQVGDADRPAARRRSAKTRKPAATRPRAKARSKAKTRTKAKAKAKTQSRATSKTPERTGRTNRS